MTIDLKIGLAPMITACLLAFVPGFATAAEAGLIRGMAVAIAPSVFVTNRDLVVGCDAIGIDMGDRRAGAHVIASDEINNLALLGADIATSGFAVLRRDPEIGEPASILSFVPLPRANLSGRLVPQDNPSGPADIAGHLVSSTIAADAGPGDDDRFLQISARLQAEDSGSPVVDALGNLVGLVDGETDALVAEELSEFDPEDIAFAIRVNAIGRLAEALHIPVAEGTAIGRELTPGMLAERVTGFTARLSCAN